MPDITVEIWRPSSGTTLGSSFAPTVPRFWPRRILAQTDFGPLYPGFGPVGFRPTVLNCRSSRISVRCPRFPPSRVSARCRKLRPSRFWSSGAGCTQISARPVSDHAVSAQLRFRPMYPNFSRTIFREFVAGQKICDNPVNSLNVH